MTKNVGTMSEWQKALDEVEQQRMQNVPVGWINSREYAAENNCATSTAEKQLRRLVDAERVEFRKYNGRRYYHLIAK